MFRRVTLDRLRKYGKRKAETLLGKKIVKRGLLPTFFGAILDGKVGQTPSNPLCERQGDGLPRGKPRWELVSRALLYKNKFSNFIFEGS
jgi:hypothetical protein